MLAHWTLSLAIAVGGRASFGPEGAPDDDDLSADAVGPDEADEADGEVSEETDEGSEGDVEPVDAGADAHVRAATEAYQAGDFELAANEISRAYELAPSSNLLFPWAQAERQRGDCNAAIRLYARYLAEDPGETTADLARDHIETCVATLEQERAAERAAVRAETTRATSQDRTWIRDPIGGALVGGGVVFMGVGVGMMIGARSMMIDALESDHANYASESGRAVTVDRLGIAGLGIGVALVAGGIVRYVLVHRRSKRESAARIDVGPDLRLHF